MPRFVPTEGMEIFTIPSITGTFQFSGVKANTKNLKASEYTLITVVADNTGSVRDFADHLYKTLLMIVEGCKKNTRSTNLLLRVLYFNENVVEIHGFKLLKDIDVSQYPKFKPDGLTAVRDAIYSAVGATVTYSEELMKQEYDVNGAIYIITDGVDNKSIASTEMIKNKIVESLNKETVIQSLLTILVGVRNPKSPYVKEIDAALSELKEEAGLTKYVDFGKATPETLAKLGNLISESISSVSQSLNSGGASQPVF